jgi:hypothetical protein
MLISCRSVFQLRSPSKGAGYDMTYKAIMDLKRKTKTYAFRLVVPVIQDAWDCDWLCVILVVLRPTGTSPMSYSGLKFLHVLLHYTGEDPAGFR